MIDIKISLKVPDERLAELNQQVSNGTLTVREAVAEALKAASVTVKLPEETYTEMFKDTASILDRVNLGQGFTDARSPQYKQQHPNT